jgi:trimeric autotransporter adhesin
MWIRILGSSAILLALLWSGGLATAQCVRGWVGDDAIGVPLGRGVSAMATWDADGDGPMPERLVVATTTFPGRVLAWDGRSWEPIGGDFNDVILSLSVFQGQLYCGGVFRRVEDRPCRYVARWDGSQWFAFAPVFQPQDGPGAWEGVNALLADDDRLWMGGNFAAADGVPCNSIGYWDGESWQCADVGLSPQQATIAAFTRWRGETLMLGEFGLPGCCFAGGLARWTGSDWTSVDQSGGGSRSGALAAYQDQLYVGGQYVGFHHGGHFDSVRALGRWNDEEWSDVGGARWDYILATAEYEGLLVAAGRTYLGPPSRHIAAWNGGAWQPLGEGMDRPIWSLAEFRGDLVAGGEFNLADGRPARRFARWTWIQPGDVDRDRAVDLTDISLLMANFGTSSGAAHRSGDVDDDGDVDLVDLALVLTHFGEACR